MSTTVLKLIPSKPDFVPEELNQTKAELFLKNIFKESEIASDITNDIEFVDQGANFENAFCNYCGQSIDIEYWQDAMDRAFEDNFKTLTFTTPCCHKISNLNDLRYNLPAGFAKFSIVISDPPNDVMEDEFIKLEKILETKITKIWAHY